MAACEDHLSCRVLAEPVKRADVTLDSAGQTALRVRRRQDILGSVGDRSFPRHDGGTRERWTAFGGGDHLGDFDSQEEAVAAVIGNANNSAFSWRLALHG